MKKRVLRTLKAAIALTLVLTLSVPAFASEKDEAKQTLAVLEQQKAALQSKLADLQEDKESTEAYIAELDKEIAAVMEEILRLAGELERTQAELEQTQADLVVAKEKEAEQYKALKARIKSMYEAGDPSLMEIFLKAQDLSTILNATDYISRISDYDNQLLTALYETRLEIERLEALLEEQKAELEYLKLQEEAKMEELELVMDAKKKELESLEVDIHDAYGDILSTEAEIENTKDIIAAIEYQEYLDRLAAEQALKQQQAQQQQQQQQGSGNTSGGTSTPSYGGATNFIFPCAGGYISSYYGGRTSPTAGASSNHKGVDIAAGSGTPILASAGGTVVSSSYSGARGYYVVVSHGNGVSSLYQHCSSIAVSVGQYVSQGQVIAYVGSTGISTGPHLHYEVLINGVNVDPYPNYM